MKLFFYFLFSVFFVFASAQAMEKNFDIVLKGGESWKQDIGNNLSIIMDSFETKDGWSVEIIDKMGDIGYMHPVTPPYRFGNPLQIGSGYGEKVSSSYNFDRDLLFLTKREDMLFASKAMEKILWEYRNIPNFPSQEYALNVISKMKTGKIKMQAFERTFSNDGGESPEIKNIHYKIKVVY